MKRTQTTLENFISVGNVEQSSDSEEDSNKDVNYYQQLLKKQSAVKETTKIVTTGGIGAECWQFFGQLHIGSKHILPKFKFCKLCFEEATILKGFGIRTSTTNYTNHIKSCHNKDVKSLNYKKTKEATKNSLFASSTKLSKFSNARRLAEMCCIDLQPFYIVERKGFQKYIKLLYPDIVFPSSSTVATAALNDVYDVYFAAVKKQLEKCPNNINLVLDMWTDKYKKISYINTKVHFCEDFEMKSFSLNTEHFPHPHTAVAVAQKVLDSLKLYGIENRSITAVSDGGSNIVAALKIQKIQRLDCLAHKLHRFLTHDILNNYEFKKYNDIITKLKKICRALSYRGEEIRNLQLIKQQEKVYEIIAEIQKVNLTMETDEGFISGDLEFGMEAATSTSSDLQSELQSALHTPALQSLKNQVETRWNSMLRMIKSFSQNFDVVNITLLNINKQNLIIGEMEREVINEFGDFLEVFSEATTYLQGQEYATISTCIYFYECIFTKLVEKAKTSCFGMSIDIYDFASKHFLKRFTILKIHLVAALMDPCQKNWKVLHNYVQKVPNNQITEDNFVLNKDVADPITKVDLIFNEMKKYGIAESLTVRNSSGEPPSKIDKVSGTRKKMLDFVASSQEDIIADPLILEIERYFSVKVTATETLEWWEQHKTVFPSVAKLANIFFGIPATSASSEIAFSVAGSCITEKRSRLHPTTAKKQLFVHDNYKMVQKLL